MKERFLSFFRIFITLRKQHKYNLLEKYPVLFNTNCQASKSTTYYLQHITTYQHLFKRSVMYM